MIIPRKATHMKVYRWVLYLVLLSFGLALGILLGRWSLHPPAPKYCVQLPSEGKVRSVNSMTPTTQRRWIKYYLNRGEAIK